MCCSPGGAESEKNRGPGTAVTAQPLLEGRITMEKLDLKKKYKHLYIPSAKEVSVVDVPKLKFIMLDGAIEPGKSPGNSPNFELSMSALYSMAYTLKFMSKKREIDPIDYILMGLEGLWWVEEGEFDINEPGNWLYTLMILQPDHITEEMFSLALEQLVKKKPNPFNNRLRLEAFHEGLCLQIMHIGPYSEEMRTIARMDAFAEENGYRMHGKHHEIYLGDPRRTDPSKLKTVLRHPVEKARDTAPA